MLINFILIIIFVLDIIKQLFDDNYKFNYFLEKNIR
jgi:hypothetical protein